MFGRLKVTHISSSFWEKCSYRKNDLSTEYSYVQEVVKAADAYFKVRHARLT